VALLKRPDWLDHQTAVGFAFAVKTFAASLLALYIAFWAGLDDPRWAFLTVFVVSQPDSGLVLAKSFYRILGSKAGVLVTIALVFGLAQCGELFVTALAMDLFLQLCRPCRAQFRVIWLPARRLHGSHHRHPGRSRPERSLTVPSR
jgi:uncharacterized membrane protein YgaE (UPF0421/DUF939 family)